MKEHTTVQCSDKARGLPKVTREKTSWLLGPEVLVVDIKGSPSQPSLARGHNGGKAGGTCGFREFCGKVG